MSAPGVAIDAIALPERLDRPGRLGPFPSAASALKFLLVSAVGALIALRWGPILWPPFLAVGLIVALHRRDGLTLDEQTYSYLRWRWRLAHPRASGHGGGPGPSGAYLRLANGRWAGGLEAGGLPLAFRPAEDAAHVFDAYRHLLRSISGPCVFQIGRLPLRAELYRPKVEAETPSERPAQQGYIELVRLLARRRHHRRVRCLLLSDPGPGATALPRLEREINAFRTMLEALEIPCQPLHGVELARALASGLSSTGAA